MFRFLRKQTVNAVRGSGPLLSSGTILRYVPSIQTPRTSPLGYDTIAGRFSSLRVDPNIILTYKRQDEARDRGEFFDVHDGVMDPADYDILITGISHRTLKTTIAKKLGIPYLSKATKTEVASVGEGYIHGKTLKPIIPCVVSNKGQGRWVFFIVDTSVPFTYISAQVSKALGIPNQTHATIGGYSYPVYVSPRKSHFSGISILGGDYCGLNKTVLWFDYPNRRVKLLFGRRWKLTGDPQL